MKIKAWLYQIGPLRRCVTRLRDSIKKRRYQKRYAHLAVDEKRILFCAYSGRQYACSPRALYEMLKEEKEDYTFVWAFRDPDAFAKVHDARTRLVTYGSDDFYRELASCKYWVFNTRVPGDAVKKDNQVYVQTWHGTPLKRLGYDVEHYIKGADDKKSLRYSYRTDAKRYDVLLSPSAFYSQKMTSAFHLKELGKADVLLEQGYPRNDSLYAGEDEKKAVRASVRANLGIGEDEFVILYAPTWRENRLNPSAGSTYGTGISFAMPVDLHRLSEAAGRPCKVLLRTHYFVKDEWQSDRDIINVSRYPDINALYIAADLLITDYSSVFFDYAILNKPILFYMYDLDAYQNVRDFYFPLSELPGKIIKEEEDLYRQVGSVASGEIDIDYEAFHDKFNPIGGPVSKQVWREIEKKIAIK